MAKRCLGLFTMIAAAALVVLPATPGFTDSFVVQSCTELLRMADAYRDDFKTANVILGSAIDAGDMEKVRAYKLKKSAAKQSLDTVVKALELKGCLKAK
ncbi:MAG: hypothetical protein HY914_03155 [Desulfomonile tiedjei]|nr:hypothetical protein [Desulfomonile tiedjei]